jgi:hypothetical protein
VRQVENELPRSNLFETDAKNGTRPAAVIESDSQYKDIDVHVIHPPLR